MIIIDYKKALLKLIFLYVLLIFFSSIKNAFAIDNIEVFSNEIKTKIEKIENKTLENEKKIIETQHEISSTNFKFDTIKYEILIIGIIGISFLSYIIFHTKYSAKKQVEISEKRVDSILRDYEQRLNIITEQNDQIIKRQEGQNNELMQRISDNIKQTTDLFKALESIFKFQEEADKIREQLIDLQKKDLEKDQVRKNIIIETNKDAINICRNFNRSNYMSIENQQKFHEFYLKLNPRVQEYKLDDNDNELNANCYLIYGLNFQIRNITDPLENLDKAIRKSERYAMEETDPILYPGMNREEIKNWNTKLANICLYHSAILLYNFGEYKQAVNKFKEALKYDKNDIKSRIYIPEAKFLGFLVDDFQEIVNDFNEIEKDIINSEDTSSWSDDKDSLLSQLYVRFGNCYFSNSKFDPYKKYRSLNNSIDKYEKAYHKSPNSYLAKFSYAQALSARAKQKGVLESQKKQDQDKSNELFRDVFSQVREKISNTSEVKILMMYYYILTICCMEAKIENENSKIYLLQIYREFSNLPSKNKIRIFSPRTKNDLNSSDFIKEVKELESII